MNDVDGLSSQAIATESAWERISQALAEWLPYVGLALSAALGLAQPNQAWQARIVTAALVTLAGMWVFFMYSRAPRLRSAHRARMIAYFIGLLLIGSVMMARQPIFFAFVVSGFFQASELRPRPLMVLGVAATSILLNTITTGFPWPTLELWILFTTIIAIQTVAIGYGTVLGERVAEQSEQRRRAVAQLEAALEENAQLHAQLLAHAREAGVLDERQRLAREIHDTLAQGLIGIITQLEAMKQAQDHPAEWQRHLDNAVRLARESLAEARRSVEASRPQALAQAELPDALAEVARQWSATHNVPAEVHVTGAIQPLHDEVETALLRVVQEALANVAKHARAARVDVTLSYMGDVVTLDVRDDGVGFVAPEHHTRNSANGTGFGLTAMRQRIQRVAGTLDIESEPGGTVISARVPAIPAQQLHGVKFEEGIEAEA